MSKYFVAFVAVSRKWRHHHSSLSEIRIRSYKNILLWYDHVHHTLNIDFFFWKIITRYLGNALKNRRNPCHPVLRMFFLLSDLRFAVTFIQYSNNSLSMVDILYQRLKINSYVVFLPWSKLSFFFQRLKEISVKWQSGNFLRILQGW